MKAIGYNTKAWEDAIDQCSFIGIQLSHKEEHKDGVERDEGIWLYSDPDTKIDVKPFFKDIALADRISLLERAEKSTIKLIKELLSKAQNEEKQGADVMNEFMAQLHSALFNDRDISGCIFPDQILDSEVWELAGQKSRIKLCTMLLQGMKWRYAEALRLLNNLEYVTTNHDYR